MNSFDIEQKTSVDDEIGGTFEEWAVFKLVKGYIDLVTGTDLNTLQNATIEQSTHILIIPIFIKGITDDMRIVDSNGRIYGITYSDDPVGIGHHNEVYCKYEGDVSA
ncbi:MAG: phage head closure protein [Carnobacterium inhibens]|uniref:phage head closure protein n=1 Tax=Carnobacterium sp. TaxID=48221 RepID=UPI0033144FF4